MIVKRINIAFNLNLVSLSLRHYDKNYYEFASSSESPAESAVKDKRVKDLVAHVRGAVDKLLQDMVTDLCYAASKGDMRQMRLALRGGDFNANSADYDGRAAMHLAAANGKGGAG